MEELSWPVVFLWKSQISSSPNFIPTHPRYLTFAENLGITLPNHPKLALMIDLLFGYRFSLISLSLFYSSLTKLFLLFLLTIWLPAPTSIIPTPENPLPEWTKHLQWANSDKNLLTHVLEILDDDKLDREWIVRNILGGMSAGFGLRGKCLTFLSNILR